MFSAVLSMKSVPTKKTVIHIHSTPLLVFRRNKPLFFRPISSFQICSLTKLYPQTDSSAGTLTESTSSEGDSDVVSYLMDSCGLSEEAAISASKKFKFETRERPDSVLGLFRTYGFTENQISKLVRKRPRLLLVDPEKTLLPKLEYFWTFAISRSDLARLLSQSPIILERSLENHIIPSYNILQPVLQSDKKVLYAMTRISRNVSSDDTKYVAPNLAVLREFEVPESCIRLLLANHPEAILRKHEQFKEMVNKVKEMGFEPSKSTFVLALLAISGKGSKTIWDRCYESYQKWGWSKDEILAAFKKHPQCMVMSEKKIERVMDLLVNKMGWRSTEIKRYPAIMLFSLEKRIVPRCLVYQVLSSKGLLRKISRLSTILVPREELFLERYVIRYEKEVPQLLGVYQGKVDILEL